MIIQLQLPDGVPVVVNSDHVVLFQPSDDQTLITVSGGGSITVQEAFEAVAELFNPERQAAGPC